MESSPQESPDAKAEFRKPSGDAANRKYRRRSPLDRSSSLSDDSPSRDRRSSPVSRRDFAKISDDRRKKDDGRDLDKDSGRTHYGRGGESYRYSDRQSSRSSHSYHRHDDYDRRDKYADDNGRDNSKLSSRLGRDSRGNAYSDHPKRGNEHRSRDSPREFERYSRDKSDDSGHRSRDKERDTLGTEYQKYKQKDSSSERVVSGRRHSSSNAEDVKSGDRDRRKEDKDTRDYKTDRRRGFGDYQNNHSPAHEESRDYQNDSTSRRDSSGLCLYGSSRGDTKEYKAEKYKKEEKKKHDDRDSYKERNFGESREKVEDGKSLQSKGRDSPAKRPKVFSVDASSGHGNDEKQSSSSKEALESVGKMTSEQAYVTDADIDAAKIAAMKAAELVNRNLVGTGYMSTEQKKKLLWGNKKTTIAEESAHRWETTLFDDRERQEKFNKLMGVKGDIKVEHKAEVDDAEKQKIQLDLEKQYTAGLRRRDGRTVGLGL